MSIVIKNTPTPVQNNEIITNKNNILKKKIVINK